MSFEKNLRKILGEKFYLYHAYHRTKPLTTILQCSVCDHFSWESKEKPHHHQAITSYKPHYRFLGRKIVSAPISNQQSGPYIHTVCLELKFLGFTVKRILVIGIIPIHGNKQRVVSQLYTEGNFLTKRLDRPLLVLSSNNVS